MTCSCSRGVRKNPEESAQDISLTLSNTLFIYNIDFKISEGIRHEPWYAGLHSVEAPFRSFWKVKWPPTQKKKKCKNRKKENNKRQEVNRQHNKTICLSAALTGLLLGICSFSHPTNEVELQLRSVADQTTKILTQPICLVDPHQHNHH